MQNSPSEFAVVIQPALANLALNGLGTPSLSHEGSLLLVDLALGTNHCNIILIDLFHWNLLDIEEVELNSGLATLCTARGRAQRQVLWSTIRPDLSKIEKSAIGIQI